MSDLQTRLRAYADWLVSCALGNIPEEAATAYEAVSRISQQDAELERVRRELEEAKEFRAILEGHLSAAIDDYNDALKALEPFAEAAASYDPPENDDGHAAWAHDFTIGSLRRARAVSRAKTKETDL